MNPYRHIELAPTREMIDWEREVRLREVGLLRSLDGLSALGDGGEVAAQAMMDPATFKAQVRAQALRSLESQGPESRVSVEAFDEAGGRTYTASWEAVQMEDALEREAASRAKPGGREALDLSADEQVSILEWEARVREAEDAVIASSAFVDDPATSWQMLHDPLGWEAAVRAQALEDLRAAGEQSGVTWPVHGLDIPLEEFQSRRASRDANRDRARDALAGTEAWIGERERDFYRGQAANNHLPKLRDEIATHLNALGLTLAGGEVMARVGALDRQPGDITVARADDPTAAIAILPGDYRPPGEMRMLTLVEAAQTLGITPEQLQAFSTLVEERTRTAHTAIEHEASRSIAEHVELYTSPRAASAAQGESESPSVTTARENMIRRAEKEGLSLDTSDFGRMNDNQRVVGDIVLRREESDVSVKVQMPGSEIILIADGKAPEVITQERAARELGIEGGGDGFFEMTDYMWEQMLTAEHGLVDESEAASRLAAMRSAVDPNARAEASKAVDASLAALTSARATPEQGDDGLAGAALKDAHDVAAGVRSGGVRMAPLPRRSASAALRDSTALERDLTQHARAISIRTKETLSSRPDFTHHRYDNPHRKSSEIQRGDF